MKNSTVSVMILFVAMLALLHVACSNEDGAGEGVNPADTVMDQLDNTPVEQGRAALTINAQAMADLGAQFVCFELYASVAGGGDDEDLGDIVYQDCIPVDVSKIYLEYEVYLMPGYYLGFSWLTDENLEQLPQCALARFGPFEVVAHQDCEVLIQQVCQEEADVDGLAFLDFDVQMIEGTLQLTNPVTIEDRFSRICVPVSMSFTAVDASEQEVNWRFEVMDGPELSSGEYVLLVDQGEGSAGLLYKTLGDYRLRVTAEAENGAFDFTEFTLHGAQDNSDCQKLEVSCGNSVDVALTQLVGDGGSSLAGAYQCDNGDFSFPGWESGVTFRLPLGSADTPVTVALGDPAGHMAILKAVNPLGVVTPSWCVGATELPGQSLTFTATDGALYVILVEQGGIEQGNSIEVTCE